MSTDYQLNYPNPIKKTTDITHTTQKISDHNISINITKDQSLRFFDINEKEGMIRKPGPAEPNALENFKPKIFDLVPELKNLTDEEFEKILEDDNDDD